MLLIDHVYANKDGIFYDVQEKTTIQKLLVRVLQH